MWGRKLSEGGKKLADYGFSRPHASKVLKMNLWSVLEDDFWTLSSPAPLHLHLTINFVHEKLIFSKIIINFFLYYFKVFWTAARTDSGAERGWGGFQKSNNMKLPEFISLFFLNAYFILCGAAIKRITYSKVNQPTNTASATSKKYSSSEIKKWKVRKLKKYFIKKQNLAF